MIAAKTYCQSCGLRKTDEKCFNMFCRENKEVPVARSWLDEKLDDAGFARGFCEEGAALYMTEGICEAMEKQGVSREELAKRLGVTKGALTRIFRGTSKLTVNQVGAIAWALGCDIPMVFKGTR